MKVGCTKQVGFSSVTVMNEYECLMFVLSIYICTYMILYIAKQYITQSKKWNITTFIHFSWLCKYYYLLYSPPFPQLCFICFCLTLSSFSFSFTHFTFFPRKCSGLTIITVMVVMIKMMLLFFSMMTFSEKGRGRWKQGNYVWLWLHVSFPVRAERVGAERRDKEKINEEKRLY